MKTLLVLAAAAAFSIPAFAQTQQDPVIGSRGTIGGEIAFMVSKDFVVESRVAYAGYLFTAAELDSTGPVEDFGYHIQEAGLFYDYGPQGPVLPTRPWEHCAYDLDFAARVAQNRGKLKAQAELAQRAKGTAVLIKRAAQERNVDARATSLDAIVARIPMATEGIQQLEIARDLDRLEASLSK